MKIMGTVEEVVKVRNVFFRYDKEYVLENINLDIFQGDYLGIGAERFCKNHIASADAGASETGERFDPIIRSGHFVFLPME